MGALCKQLSKVHVALASIKLLAVGDLCQRPAASTIPQIDCLTAG